MSENGVATDNNNNENASSTSSLVNNSSASATAAANNNNSTSNISFLNSNNANDFYIYNSAKSIESSLENSKANFFASFDQNQHSMPVDTKESFLSIDNLASFSTSSNSTLLDLNLLTRLSSLMDSNETANNFCNNNSNSLFTSLANQFSQQQNFFSQLQSNNASMGS